MNKASHKNRAVEVRPIRAVKHVFSQSILKKMIIAIFSTAVFLQFLLIPWPYIPNFSCGQNLTHNWCPQLVLLHYFAIKVMFEVFYWKHFSIILYGKSQPVLIISWGECNNVFKTFIWPNAFGYRLGTAKTSLRHFHSFWSYLEKPEGVKMTPLVL